MKSKRSIFFGTPGRKSRKLFISRERTGSSQASNFEREACSVPVVFISLLCKLTLKVRHFSVYMQIAKDMERWAKKQAKGKDVGRPQTATQATQEAAKESSYQYDPNDFKVRKRRNDIVINHLFPLLSFMNLV